MRKHNFSIATGKHICYALGVTIQPITGCCACVHEQRIYYADLHIPFKLLTIFYEFAPSPDIRYNSWYRYTSWKVAGWLPDEVIGFIN
jgi:hypothetical protein